MNATNEAQPDPRREEFSLDRRYGKIGISAVAAALPYQSEAKNQAYAPALHQYERFLSEQAA